MAGWWLSHQPLWKMMDWKSVGMMTSIPNCFWKVIKIPWFQTTNQYLYIMPNKMYTRKNEPYHSVENSRLVVLLLAISADLICEILGLCWEKLQWTMVNCSRGSWIHIFGWMCPAIYILFFGSINCLAFGASTGILRKQNKIPVFSVRYIAKSTR